MAGEPIRLTLQVDLGDDADPEELEEAVESLLAELAEAPVDVERPAPGDAPPGSKGAGHSAMELLLTTGGAAALEIAADYVKDWLGRRRRARVRVKSETGNDVVVIVPDMSPDQVRSLVMQLSRSALA